MTQVKFGREIAGCNEGFGDQDPDHPFGLEIQMSPYERHQRFAWEGFGSLYAEWYCVGMWRKRIAGYSSESADTGTDPAFPQSKMQ